MKLNELKVEEANVLNLQINKNTELNMNVVITEKKIKQNEIKVENECGNIKNKLLIFDKGIQKDNKRNNFIVKDIQKNRKESNYNINNDIKGNKGLCLIEMKVNGGVTQDNHIGNNNIHKCTNTFSNTNNINKNNNSNKNNEHSNSNTNNKEKVVTITQTNVISQQRAILSKIETKIASNQPNSTVLSTKTNSIQPNSSQFSLNKPSSPPIFLTPSKYTFSSNSSSDCFCEAFFIASFPKLNAKVIENSQTYPSICNHNDCSMLPAMESEIIFRYPLKNTQTLELNNLAATICFPTGIKVCYQESPYPSPIPNYLSSITNQTGDRYYMFTYHFYNKITNTTYSSQYEIHPLKYHLRKFADEFIDKDDLDKKEIEAIQENLELCKEFGFKETVYVPYCICLISKYPYTHQIQKCIESLFHVITKNHQNNLINNIIMFLIHSIPIPPPNTSLNFYLPYISSPLTITCPKYKDINLINTNLSFLFTLFSPDDIIQIWRMLLFEKKVLFVDTNYNRLSEVMSSFLSLLYPLTWVHTHIPIMSIQMIQYLETFLPFLNGVNATLMENVHNTLSQTDYEVYIINIEKKEIGVNLQWKNKTLKAFTQLNYTTPRIPAKFKLLLEQELKSISIDTCDKCVKDIKIKNAFIDTFIRMFYDYKKFLNIVDNDAVFNNHLFIEKRAKDDKVFYTELMETQSFMQFVQNVSKEEFVYFNSRIKYYNDKNENKEQKFQKVIDNALKIEHVYVIKPFFLNEVSNDISNIEKEMKYKYKETTFQYITDKTISINNNNYNTTTLNTYMIPSSNSNNNVVKKLKLSNSLSNLNINDYPKSKERFLYLENIKETIKDTVISIFKSHITNDNSKDKTTEIVKAITDKQGREFFISLLYNNNTNTEIKILQLESYSFLLFLITNTLFSLLTLQQNETITSQAVLLFKASKLYAYQENKTKVCLLWNDLIHKVKDTFQLTNRFDFWKSWVDITIKEYEKEGKGRSVENVIFNNVVDNMIKMGLENQFMKVTIEKIVKEKINKDEKIVERIRKKLEKILMERGYRKRSIFGKKVDLINNI